MRELPRRETQAEITNAGTSGLFRDGENKSMELSLTRSDASETASWQRFNLEGRNDLMPGP
jgi:hypothetical protein